jgi:glycosyltransferase involved in cell wall biosynthesis
MRSVYFVQCKYPGESVELNNMLDRWNLYGSKLDKSIGKNSISVISPKGMPNLDKSFEFLRIDRKSKGFLRSMIQVAREINERDVKATFVAGDNQLALLFCIFSSLLLRGKIRIQCQFHGDLYTREVNHGLRGAFRLFTSRVAIRVSSSIRIVSLFQEKQLNELFPNIQGEFIVAPIPLDYSKIVTENVSTPVHDVALVGRLHPERGISEATMIIKQLCENNPCLKIVIVGRGQEEAEMRKVLQNQVSSGAVEFVGLVSSIEVRNIYSTTKVLLSTAPSEGYGLTLREAALSGLQVVVRANHGSQEASFDFPDHISLYEDPQEAISTIESFLRTEKSSTPHKPSITKQRHKEILGLQALIASWTTD